MSRLNKRELIDRFVKAVRSKGWNILYLSKSGSHPADLQIFSEEESYKVRLYIWNITHGGKTRAEDEYRIQITGTNQFIPIPGGKVLIMGWWEDVGVFAGFDYSRHSGILGASPSFQIRRNYLEQAYRNGFSVCDKGNRELAIAIRPDFLVDYVKNLEDIHRFGDVPNAEVLLDRVSEIAASNAQLNDGDIGDLPSDRKRIVTNVNRAIRSNNFRARVLTAYSNKCAVCGVQLELIDAAHIVPVGHPRSTDDTYNGMALCPTHHRAYDRGLIGINLDYHVITNEGEFERLQSIGFDGGERHFRRSLRPIIHMPPAVGDRPNIQLLRLALEIRNINL